MNAWARLFLPIAQHPAAVFEIVFRDEQPDSIVLVLEGIKKAAGLRLRHLAFFRGELFGHAFCFGGFLLFFLGVFRLALLRSLDVSRALLLPLLLVGVGLLRVRFLVS